MLFHIRKNAAVPIRKQLSEQIVFLIATGKLKAGDSLPSVRELALRYKINANTVSEAYKDLVRRHWVKRQQGARMLVRALDEPLGSREDLEELIDATIRTALQRGHTLQDLRKRVRERLLIQPPDHVLVIEDEPGLRQIVRQELSEMLNLTVEAIAPDSLTENQGRLIGALVVSLPGRAKQVVSLLPSGHPFLSLRPTQVETHFDLVRQLKEPSLIGIVSVSEQFLWSARALLAPVLGNQHALEEQLLDGQPRRSLARFDLVFCDSVARHRIRARKVVPYRLMSAEAATDISNRIDSAAD